MGIDVWDRMMGSRADQEADELKRESADRSCGRICDCAPGDNVTIAGTVRSITLRPRTEAPALEIDLYDGSGSIRVVWLGRRRIQGVSAGRRLVITGRLNKVAGRPVVYNPRYELKPKAA